MEDIINKLSEAVSSGEILTIKYHGGSQPGAQRQISPISVNGPKVRARCLTSDAVKVFIIEKIELCGERPDAAEVWEPGRLELQQYESLSDVYAAHSDNLISMGWHVVFEDDRITLHRIRKNGTPLKGTMSC